MAAARGRFHRLGTTAASLPSLRFPNITPATATPSTTRLASSSTTCSLPPAEWISPFVDVSGLAAHTPPRDLRASPWLQRVLRLLLDTPLATVEAGLDDFCRKFLIKLPPPFVSQALRSPDIRARPDAALRFFLWAACQPDFPGHNLQSYASLVEILSCGSGNNREAVRDLVVEIRARGVPMTPPSAGLLVRSLGAMGMVEELLCVWRMMKQSGLEPDLLSYNCLLDGLVTCAFVDSAEKVFLLLESGKTGVRPDVVTYNTMIKGYCNVGKTQVAMEKLLDMEKKSGATPDKITFMTLIQANYADGEFDTCFLLYRDMEDRGLEIPDHAYTLVAAGMCKDGKPFEALAVFENMRSRGCKGNVAIYTTLIDCFAKSGNQEQAMTLFERMKADKFEPDAVTYGVVVNCLCKSGKLEKAMEWFEFCQSSGLAVNVFFYSSLIDAFGKAGKVDEAQRLFTDMMEKGHVPDAYCYNALIDAFCKSGHLDEALSIFKKMESEGCDHNVYTYTILIDGLFRKHKNEEALRFWYRMIDKGITPTPASFRILSAGLCLSGKVERAFKILDDLAPMGVIPDTAYLDMINVLCKAGRISQACKLADEIVDKEREIPGKVRSMFINALRKAGKADLAIKMLHSKIGIGYDRVGSIKRRVKFQSLLST